MTEPVEVAPAIERTDLSGTRIPNLVFDVGLHRGEDTAFYLALGYRVVAFEADPEHVRHCRARFEAELADGRLTLVEGAIAKTGVQSIAFFRNTANSSWGTTDGEWVGRREATAGFERVEVNTVDFPAALREHGIPHFMKIDIEGADRLCLESLKACAAKPRYLSIESDKLSFSEVTDELELFAVLGYQRFAVVQQAAVPGSLIETRDIKGHPLRYRFERDASGAFGRDVGPWIDRDAAIKRYRQIFFLYKIFGEGGLLRSFRLGRIVAVRLPRYKGHRIPGWYDTHAEHGSSIVSGAMATFEELNALSSKELHDKATSRAKRHLDIEFYWGLMKFLPAAEVAAGNQDQSTADIFKIGSLIHDFIEAEDGSDHLDALRPYYIDYLEQHG